VLDHPSGQSLFLVRTSSINGLRCSLEHYPPPGSADTTKTSMSFRPRRKADSGTIAEKPTVFGPSRKLRVTAWITPFTATARSKVSGPSAPETTPVMSAGTE